MSISSLYTGITGLIGYSQAMSVIGNNIANVNTVGFKESRMDFSDILSHSVGGVSGQFQVGRGVRISAVERQFSQSAFESTNSGSDLAINGEGFFIVKGSDGVNYYTRAGQFHTDELGKLVNDQGYVLQGYLLDSDGNIINNVTQDIDLSTVSSEPRATTGVDLHLNLDSESTGKDPALFDANDPSTYNYSTTLNVYDSLGNAHALSVYLIKDSAATNAWTWATGLTDTGGNPIQGTLGFTTSGLLDTESAGVFTVNFDSPNVADQTITFDFGDSITTDGGAGTGTTQYSGTSTTLFLSQDGYPAGDLSSIQIDTNGVIGGWFDNGQTKSLYQLGLGRFISPWGLDSVGNNLFIETLNSGAVITGPPKTAGFGDIQSNSLELSNVDLSQQFVEMIRVQHAFSANSRIITTADSMLQEVMNLKRR